MKKHKNIVLNIVAVALCLFLFSHAGYGQTCTGSTPANPGAQTGNLYTASPINPGSTSTVHYVTGVFTVATANITMSGTSKLVIKTGSSLTITGAYDIPAGCMIYVESGAMLTVTGQLSCNSSTSSLVNLGTVNISTIMRPNGGAVYNDGTLTATTSLLITSTTFIFLNGGSASFGYIHYNLGSQATSSICLRPGSIFNISSASGWVITGPGVSLPAGGLFKYNATDITNNSACSTPNPARINYYQSFIPSNPFVWGPAASAANPVADNANIVIVGSTPATSNTGACVLVTSGTGYSAAAPQNFNLTTFSPVPTIVTPPIATVIPNYFEFCLNATVPLAAMATGTNRLWYTSATGGVGSATAPTVNTSSAGLQTFWVSQNVTASCEGPRNPINIRVLATAASSAVTATATNGGLVCVGGNLALTGGGTGIGSWNWTGPNSFSNSTQSPTVSASATVAMSGTYLLIAQQTAGACYNAAFVTVVVSSAAPSQPSVITPSTTTPCNASTGTTYSVTNVAGVSYAWSYGGTGASITAGAGTNSITVTYSAATNGTWTVTPSNGCGSGTARTLAVTLTNGVPAQPSTIAPSTANPCNTSTGITYTVTNVAGTTYAWSYGGTGASITSGSTTNSITVDYASATSGSWTVTPSNSCGNGTTRTLAVSPQTAGTWNGTTSTAWTTTSNWSCGTVPTSSSDAVIPSTATNMPIISSSINVRNLTINASAKLITNAAGTLNLFGNFTNNGTYYDAGTTAFVGSTAQVKSGVADSINNMTVNNSAGVTVSAATYVKRYLTLTAGTLASGGNLTVDIYFGAILGAGSGSISGNITVVRTMWKDNWKYISSPLSGRTVADWNTVVPIKFGANANLYTYDETNTSTNKSIGWTAVASTGVALTSMRGYALYFPLWKYKTDFSMTGTYTHSQTYTNAALTNTSSGVALSDGWNLVGNPYPSEIDWNAASGWTKTGLDNAIYFWDQANNRYATYVSGAGTNGGTQYIPCMQGFYVRVTNPGTGTLSMNNNVRSSAVNRDNWRVAANDDVLRLKVTNNSYSDETVVRLMDNASDQFDTQYDAYKLPSSGSTPSISTTLCSTDFSVNSISRNTFQKTLPIKLVAGLNGTHAISADLTGFQEAEYIMLEDRLLGINQDLKSSPLYTCDLAQADTTSRFYLHYKSSNKQTTTTNTTTDSFNATGIRIFAFEQNITIEFGSDHATQANISVYDAIGNQIYTQEHVDVTSGFSKLSLPNTNAGIYIVKVQSEGTHKTQQIYLQK